MIKQYKHLRDGRKARIRAKIKGTGNRPRLSIFRSQRYIYAQIIDDSKRITLVFAKSKELDKDNKGGTKIEIAKSIGRLLAEKAKKIGIKTLVFDRSGYKYHGRVKALAEGAREGGLKF